MYYNVGKWDLGLYCLLLKVHLVATKLTLVICPEGEESRVKKVGVSRKGCLCTFNREESDN